MHRMIMLAGAFFLGISMIGVGTLAADDAPLVYQGTQGPGVGKHIVFVVGDEEYRSEESMPQLARILATHHGFKCTVLFAINKQSHEIDPLTLDNIPGLEALRTADLMVMFLRFRGLPQEQMQFILDYVNSGKPVVALRTSTHAFKYAKDHPLAIWSYNAPPPHAGGFGRQVLGETWISHYGAHQKESTRGIIAKGMETHPIVRGIDDIWGESDVYGLTTLNGDCKPVIMGQVLKGMTPKDTPNDAKPALPVAWIKTYTGTQGKPSRIFTTTMGHVADFLSEGFRRLMVNACYWGMGMEEQIPERAKADLVGEYRPSKIGFGLFKKGLKPGDLK